MDTQFLGMLLKIILFLPFIVLLIIISLKYGGSKLQDIQNGKYIRVLERAAVSKENSLLVVKIGEKGYVMASTNGKIEIISELETEEILKVEASRAIPEYESIKDFYEKSGIKNFCDKTNLTAAYKKLKSKKEGSNV